MTIYDIFREDKRKQEAFLASAEENREQEEPNLRDRLFSTLASRLFFLLLFVGDLIWIVYNVCFLILCSFAALAACFKVTLFQKIYAKAWLSFRRSVVCGLALLIALFSPAFGIMVACTYFLMYDKAGIEEVVPGPLQEQFKEFFNANS